MSQLTLLQPERLVLVEDGEGGIVYQPGFVDRERAQRWFEEVRQAVRWHSDRRQMYDREVDVPRLLAHFRLQPPAAGTPAVIHEIAGFVIGATGVAFNGVGLNHYRDERDSVAPHNDHLYELIPGQPIALLSLGATRRMVIRSKPPARRVFNLDLEAGSLLTMSYASQLAWTHAIPKQRTAQAPRISLAFRVKPADRLDRY
jgi:alkylated DNA repair dioxygenase AlkB